MRPAVPLITVHADTQVAVSQATQVFCSAGLQVLPSFDLQIARSTHAHCSCPHHGTDLCDCQVMILLVYPPEAAPATLVVHGSGAVTRFDLVDNPQQPADLKLERLIRSLLAHLAKEGPAPRFAG